MAGALHLVLDNYAAHKRKEVRDWLVANPRVQVHFTPTSASWMNLVEVVPCVGSPRSRAAARVLRENREMPHSAASRVGGESRLQAQPDRMGGLITDPWLLLGPVDQAQSELEEQGRWSGERLRGAEARLLLPGDGVRGLNVTLAAEFDDVPTLDLLRLGPPEDEDDRLRVGVECLQDRLGEGPPAPEVFTRLAFRNGEGEVQQQHALLGPAGLVAVLGRQLIARGRQRPYRPPTTGPCARAGGLRSSAPSTACTLFRSQR